MTRKQYVRRVKRIRSLIFSFIVIATALTFFIDICRFPEKYSTECKEDLQDAINRGDPTAISYYQDTYVSRGIILFED